MYYTHNGIHLYIILGMQITSIMYISEISDTPKLRAFSLSLINPAIGLGTAICYITGFFLSAQYYAMTICSLTLVFFLLTFLIPESPVWLMRKKDFKGAAKASKWLQITQTEGYESWKDPQVSSVSDGLNSSLGKRILVTGAWKPLIHLTVFFFLQILTGNPVFIYYAANIYHSLNTPLNSSLSAVILALVQFFTLICVSCFIDKLDRRTWTKISSAGIFISYLIMALNEYVDFITEPSSSHWLPLVSSWVGAVFSSVGLYSIPWILLGELFPATVKDFMGGLQMMIIYVLQFLSIKTYPLLEPVLQIYGFCLIFSVGGLLSYLYAQFFMPETRGKTLAEIERFWL